MSPKAKAAPMILVTKKGGVATVTLNRPEKLNAMSPDLIFALAPVLHQMGEDDTVRCIILTGSGRAFSAGGDVVKDIRPLRDMNPLEFAKYVDHAVGIYTEIRDMQKPVIAAINGYAVGAGLELALACDIRIAADDAKLGEFFVRMGITPETGIYFLPKMIGLGKAKLLCFTGDVVNAEDAEKIGLVEMVVPAKKLISEAEALAERLAKGPAAIGIIKKAINESLKMTAETSLHYVMRMQYHLVHTEDHKEAVAAWLEKRAPKFKGK